MLDVYKSINEYNEDKERKILIVFNDLIADIINIKKLNSIETELFIRSRELNISLAFITQSYFKVPKDARRSVTHFFIMKIPNKRELQQIVLNHSSDSNSKDFIKIYKNVLLNHILFLVNDSTLVSDNPLGFRKIFSIYDKILTIKISEEKLQYDINRKATEISALLSGKN